MIPNRTKLALFDGEINLQTDTIRVALYNDSIPFTPDPDTHAFVGDVLNGTAANEFGDTNYTRQALDLPDTRQDNTVDQAQWDGADITWNSLGGTETIQGVIIYKQVGADDSTPADDPIIRIIDDTDDPDLPKPTNGSDIVVSWDASGIITMT